MEKATRTKFITIKQFNYMWWEPIWVVQDYKKQKVLDNVTNIFDKWGIMYNHVVPKVPSVIEK